MKNAIDETRRWYWSDPRRHQIGRNNLIEARREIVKRAFTLLSLPEKDANNVADQYSQKRLENVRLFDDTEETLQFLFEKGFRLALITNGESATQRFKINKFRLDKYFSEILIEGEQGIGKPDARIFETALSAIGVPRDRTCMIGDQLLYDIKGAKEVGIFAIWCDYANRGLPSDSEIVPDLAIKQLSEVKDLDALQRQ